MASHRWYVPGLSAGASFNYYLNIFLNISVNALDEGIKHSLCMFAGNTKLSWNVDLLESIESPEGPG